MFNNIVNMQVVMAVNFRAAGCEWIWWVYANNNNVKNNSANHENHVKKCKFDWLGYVSRACALSCYSYYEAILEIPEFWKTKKLSIFRFFSW